MRRQWVLGLRPGRPGPIWDSGCADYQLTYPPAGMSYADPFLIEHDGRVFVFFEQFTTNEFDGVIACAEIDASGRLTTPEIVLSTGSHVSYPYVFRDGTNIFMLPETRRAGRIELYVATRFPIEWKSACVLVDAIEAVDTTPVVHDGLFFLIAGLPQPRAPLRVGAFVAKRLEGPYVRHAWDVLPTEPGLNRPAGGFLSTPSGLLRPSQDCKQGYGRAVIFNRVDTLTPDAYAETPLARLAPPAGLAHGLHTYSVCAGFEAIDLQVPA